MFNIKLYSFLASANVKAVLEFNAALKHNLNTEVIIAGGFCRDLIMGVLPSDIDIYIFDVDKNMTNKNGMQSFVDWLSKLDTVTSDVTFRDHDDLECESEETYDLVFPERILGILDFDLKLPVSIERPNYISTSMSVQAMLIKGGFDMSFF